MSGILKKGSPARTAALAVLSYIVLLVVIQLLPGSAGLKGTPSAIILQGLIFGLLNALVACGIVLIYRTSRFINFAQAALGGIAGSFTYQFIVADTTHAPYLLAVVVGILVAALLGVIVELGFVRRFFEAPRLVLMVLTIALVSALNSASGFVIGLPLFGDVANRSLEQQRGTAPVPFPFRHFVFHVGKLLVPFRFQHLFAILTSIAALIGLGIFLRYSRFGVATRAAAENAERASLLGVPVKILSTTVWAIAGAMSGLAVVMFGSVTTFQSTGLQSPEFLVGALAAAIVAKMRSIPVAISAAIGIEILRQATKFSFKGQAGLFNVAVFLVILIGLLLQKPKQSRSEDHEASSWKATQE
ncbi:MAG: branched-chain amino acid ABC transporter permease, partial [Actinobacteria bacterium]|nr:branched-chain amino acid ABC transporter permease [Actinomycetota bacterium]